ncbi:hypothetical protein EMCRGX_G021428 [Ephydatia muelleri]
MSIENEQTRKRKRSKWDQLTPDSPPHGSLPLPTPSTPPATPSEAAAAAAARLNAMLAAQGKLSKSTTATSTVGATTASSTLSVGQTTASDSAVTAAAAFPHFTEVDINDLALDTRMSLTKGATLSEINKSTGAYVSVRGRFMTPEEKGKNTIERALHLIVQASSQTSVNAAVRKINELINPSRGAGVLPGLGGGGGTGGGGGKGQGGTRPHLHYVQDKAFVGLDQASESFGVTEKLAGPGGSFLAHIASQTSAKVHLRGRGSGFMEPTSGRESFEPLYIYISHSHQEGLSAARKLCESLIETVRKEYETFRRSQLPLGYGSSSAGGYPSSVPYGPQLPYTPAVSSTNDMYGPVTAPYPGQGSGPAPYPGSGPVPYPGLVPFQGQPPVTRPFLPSLPYGFYPPPHPHPPPPGYYGPQTTHPYAGIPPTTFVRPEMVPATPPSGHVLPYLPPPTPNPTPSVPQEPTGPLTDTTITSATLESPASQKRKFTEQLPSVDAKVESSRSSECSFSNGHTTGVPGTARAVTSDITKSGRKFVEGVHPASLDVETKDFVGRDRAVEHTGTSIVASEGVGGGTRVTSLQLSTTEANPMDTSVLLMPPPSFIPKKIKISTVSDGNAAHLGENDVALDHSHTTVSSSDKPKIAALVAYDTDSDTDTDS